MNDVLNEFKEEMNKRGLFRKIQVATNLIPYPSDVEGEHLIGMLRANAKTAILYYAKCHDDFCDLLVNAAIDHLLESVLTDELFTQSNDFTATEEEQKSMKKAKAMADIIIELLDFPKNI